MKKIICLLLSLMMALCLSACDGKQDVSDTSADADVENQTSEVASDDFSVDKIEVDISADDSDDTNSDNTTERVETNPVATLELSNGGKIVIELCYDAAPNTVLSFIAYVNADAYKDFGFTEVRNSKIVMANKLDGKYTAPFYTMDEFENNTLSHERGVVTMNRTSNSNQVTGRFSIITKDSRYFDNYCTAFGKVTSGMEYVDSIAATEVNTEDSTVEAPVVITKITVDTFGQTIPDPVIIRK